jgi:hypothetical protein
MIQISIALEMVESLMSKQTHYAGSVLLQEIKTSMETYIKNGLERGCKISLIEAFDDAWTELVFMEISEESLSDLDEEF